MNDAHAPDAPLAVVIAGMLQGPPSVFSRNGQIVVRLIVRQHLQACPDARNVVADYVYPDHGCPNATHAAAASSTAGYATHTEVLLRGDGIAPTTLHGEPALRLLGCSAFARLERGSSHPPPQETAMLRDLTIIQYRAQLEVLAHSDVIAWPDGPSIALHLVRRHGLEDPFLRAVVDGRKVEVFDVRCWHRELAVDLKTLPARDVPGVITHYARRAFVGPRDLLAGARRNLTAAWWAQPMELAA